MTEDFVKGQRIRVVADIPVPLDGKDGLTIPAGTLGTVIMSLPQNRKYPLYIMLDQPIGSRSRFTLAQSEIEPLTSTEG